MQQTFEKEKLETLIKILADYYQVDLQKIISRERTPEIIGIRQLGMYLAEELTGMPMKEIALGFGVRDHLSASFGIKKAAERIKEDTNVKKDAECIKNAYLLYIKEKLAENESDDHEKIFMAYSRKLLRELEEIRRSIRNGNVSEGEKLLSEIITDTKMDLGIENE